MIFIYRSEDLQSKKIYVPELGKRVQLKVSTTALKSIDRMGLMDYLKKQGLSLADVQ